jgi:hypothetical protein
MPPAFGYQGVHMQESPSGFETADGCVGRGGIGLDTDYGRA